MNNSSHFIVSHAPFWHTGRSIPQQSYNIMLAALPAVLFGFFQFGIAAVGVISLSVATAMAWELLLNKVMKREITIWDGNAALIGLIFGMMIPATTPWWVVIVGTMLAIVIGKMIFGGIGCNPFHPAIVSLLILMISWPDFFNFDLAYLNYDFDFRAAYPIALLKHFGPDAIAEFSYADLLLGRQIGGIGSTFGIGLIIGGGYLIARGFIRWEISVSFLAGIFITAISFQIADPQQYASPFFHLFTGYTLIGAFFLVTEDSSSPVNFIPMIIYGFLCGSMTIFIRNLGVYADGVLLAILLMNAINPLLDKIRPKALGSVG